MAKLPVISGKEAVRAFEKAGWKIVRRAKSRHGPLLFYSARTRAQYQACLPPL